MSNKVLDFNLKNEFEAELKIIMEKINLIYNPSLSLDEHKKVGENFSLAVIKEHKRNIEESFLRHYSNQICLKIAEENEEFNVELLKFEGKENQYNVEVLKFEGKEENEEYNVEIEFKYTIKN